MATVTTKAEQVRAGRVARRVGGYSELFRLAGEHERLGRDSRLERDEAGRYIVVRARHEDDRKRK